MGNHTSNICRVDPCSWKKLQNVVQPTVSLLWVLRYRALLQDQTLLDHQGFPLNSKLWLLPRLLRLTRMLSNAWFHSKKHAYRLSGRASSTIRSLMSGRENKTKIRIQNGLHLPVKPKRWQSAVYRSSEFSKSPLCSISSRCSLSLQRKYIKLKTITATQAATRY